MKRPIVFALVFFSLILSACSDSAAPSDSSSGDPALTVDSQQQATAVSSESDIMEPSIKETPFDTFQNALDDAGYSYESITMGAELVGASAGMKYKFDFGSVEIYQFEDGSKALSDAIANNGLTVEDIGVFPCVFNGNLAALIDVTENEDSILDLFNSL